MDVGRLSMSLSQSSVKSSVNLSLMKKVMSTAKDHSNMMTDMLKQSTVTAPHPTLGKQIDIKS